MPRIKAVTDANGTKFYPTSITKAIYDIDNSQKLDKTISDLKDGKADKATTLAGYGITDALPSSTKYAGSSSAGGAATSAAKLTNTSKVGDTNKPVYFTANGVPAAISYTIGTNVPSDAKFTDTTYEAATQSAAGLMSSEDKSKLDGIASGAQVNVQADWNATSGDAFIKNKPTIPDSFQWYGTSSTAADTVQKEVSIPSITSLKAGQLIIVLPTVTSTVADSTLKLNSFDAYPMRYGNAAITTSTDSIVWTANYPSVFVFDGSYWIFLTHGYDSNNTYSSMSVAEGTTGTSTKARSIAAVNLKQIIQALAPQADWNATSGDAVILNKPTIPAAPANGTYTVKTTVGETTTTVSDFTANQSSADDVIFIQGNNITLTPDATNRTITIAATDTTYESKAASENGTDLSLVTTGEKAAWNAKTSYTGTVTKVSTGAGLTGGDVTTTGTIKANLTSEVKLTNAASDGTETSGRVYPVRLDKNGRLAVNVPWSDTDTDINTATLKVSDTDNKKISTEETSGSYIQFTGGTNKITIGDGTNLFDVAVTPSITNNVTGSGLTANAVVLGNGSSAVKTSSKTITTTLGSDDTTIPTSKAVETAISNATAGLTGAMHFIGTSSTAITDGGTEAPTISGYSGTAKTSGNVVLYDSSEFVWTGSAWEKLGPEGSYVLNSVKVEGTGVLGGGGTLTENRTITHNTSGVHSQSTAQSYGPTADVNGANGNTIKVPQISVDKYGHITSVTERTYTSVNDTYTVNNGTFSVKTKVGSNTAVTAADFTANQSGTDDVTFIQGTNVTFTTDTTNRTITVAATDTTYKLNINGTNNGGGSTSLGTVYAPTAAGTAGQVLLSSGGAPNWKTGDIVHYATSVSGTAGTKSSNRSIWNGTVDGITELYTGLTVQIKIPVAGVNVGIVLNINNLGEHPVVHNVDSLVTTHYAVGSILTLVYDADQSASVTINSTATSITGCWKLSLYDSNTDVQMRLYKQITNSTTWNKDYPLIASRTLSSGIAETDGKYVAIYGLIGSSSVNPTVNPITGDVKVKSLTLNGTTLESKTASASGTDLSLVTTGEKAIWNAKTSNEGTVTGVTVGTGGTNYTPTNGVVTIPAYPTTLPASDVSAWAKANSKPSYTYSEIGYTVSATSSAGGTLSLAGTTPLHVVTLTGNVSALTLSANPAEGHSCHVILTAAAEYTVAIAHDATNRVCPGAEDISLTVPAGGYIELDFLTANSKVYVRGV